jgi:hypothetical protein
MLLGLYQACPDNPGAPRTFAQYPTLAGRRDLFDARQEPCGSIRGLLHGEHVLPEQLLSLDDLPLPAPWLEAGQKGVSRPQNSRKAHRRESQGKDSPLLQASP